MRRALLILVTSMALISAPAIADDAVVRDPKDYGGRLDIKALRHAHGPSPARLRHSIRMYGRWRNRALRRDHYSIAIYFDIKRRREERQVWIKYRKGELKAYILVLELTRRGKVRDFHRDGPVHVSRPSRRAVRAAFNVSRLNLPGDRYRWSAVLTPDAICPGSCGSDHAPEKSMIRHIL